MKLIFMKIQKNYIKNILKSYELKINYVPREVIFINIYKDFNDKIIIIGTEYGSKLIYNSSFENYYHLNIEIKFNQSQPYTKFKNFKEKKIIWAGIL